MKLPKHLQGKTWETKDGTLTSADVEAVLAKIKRRLSRASAIAGVTADSDRRIDRATQLLRKAGLIRRDGGQWVAVVLARRAAREVAEG